MDNKLITVIMGQDCENTIGMCLESVKDSDQIIYLDGGSTDNTLDIWDDIVAPIDDGRFILLRNTFDKSNPNMISIQRNFYLDYIKENYPNYWCLVLDADEVVNDFSKYKEWVKNFDDGNIDCFISPTMRHLMYTLGFEDNTQPKHYVPHRFFKIGEDLYYPKGEHTILSQKIKLRQTINYQNDDLLIWHLGYLGGVWDVKKRYDQQVLRDNGHPQEFLHNWNKTHLLGLYPIKKVNLDDLPGVILKNFGMSEEEIYFNYRKTVEPKHFVFIKQWNEFFKPKSVADFGCGVGLYLYAWEITNAKCKGFELSKYARDNKVCNSKIYSIDLNDKNVIDQEETSNLVTALDVLEHLRYDNLDNAIETLIEESDKYILTSIPYKGTPNCEMDKTHIIKENRDWWVKKFTDKGLKEVEVPDHWIFKEQLLIFEK